MLDEKALKKINKVLDKFIDDEEMKAKINELLNIDDEVEEVEVETPDTEIEVESKADESLENETDVEKGDEKAVMPEIDPQEAEVEDVESDKPVEEMPQEDLDVKEEVKADGSFDPQATLDNLENNVVEEKPVEEKPVEAVAQPDETTYDLQLKIDELTKANEGLANRLNSLTEALSKSGILLKEGSSVGVDNPSAPANNELDTPLDDILAKINGRRF